ncbi:uncharacterized protein [Clytia hemisphaerica]|uniref:uncharacterized protein n=1 Tax=Clytia hemisphaerica TaxID=252671 RepID=UPI0034D4B140
MAEAATPTATPGAMAAVATPTATPEVMAAAATPTTTQEAMVAVATPTVTQGVIAVIATPTATPGVMAAATTPTTTQGAMATQPSTSTAVPTGNNAMVASATPTLTPGAIAAAATPMATPGAMAAAATPATTPGAIAVVATPTVTPGAMAAAATPMATPGAMAAQPSTSTVATTGNNDKKEVNSDELDTTAMDDIFKNICPEIDPPLNGWESTPDDTDVKQGAHLRSLSVDRNNTQHRFYIRDDEFNVIYNRMKRRLKALGRTEKDFEDLLPPVRYGYTKPVSTFRGREKVLKEISDKVDQNEDLKLVIHAVAGTGKSEIVRRYYELNGDKFEQNILWIKADTEDSLNSSFIDIGEQLRLEVKDQNGHYKGINSIVDGVYRYLNDVQMLFVFDDVTDQRMLMKYLPSFKKQTVLITSQKSEWIQPDFVSIRLEPFDEAESKKMIREKSTKSLSEAQLNEVTQLIQGHPLSLQQFVAAINRTRLDVADFVQYFKAETGKTFEMPLFKTPYAHSAVAAIKINIERLIFEDDESQLAVKLLKRLCYIESEEVSMSVVKIICRDFDELGIDSALFLLPELSLVNIRNLSRETIVSIHSMIRETVLVINNENEEEQLVTCLTNFLQEIEVEKERISADHADFGKIFILHFIKLIQSQTESKQFQKILVDEIGQINQLMTVRGRNQVIINVCQNVLKLSNFSDHDQAFLTVNTILACAYQSKGEHDIAIHLHEETLSKMKTVFGVQHIDTLSSMDNLAIAYKEKGDYNQAIKLHEETLSKRKTVLGVNHINTLGSMNNLANAYQEKGDYNQAIKLHETTLSKMKTVLGVHHIDTLASMNNLANAYQEKGDYNQAIKLHETTLSKRKTVLGVNHIDTLLSMNNLANAYTENGDYNQAIKIHEETLSKRITVLGVHHIKTLASMNNLANAYQEKGDYNQAIKLHEETLSKRKTVLGVDHIDTLASMNNLANTYQEKGDYNQAIKMHEETLSKRKTVLGVHHIKTLASMNNLANAYTENGDYNQAIKMYEETLSKRKTVLGVHHIKTLASMNNLANTYRKKGDYITSTRLFEEALMKIKTSVSNDHPSVEMIRRNRDRSRMLLLSNNS